LQFLQFTIDTGLPTTRCSRVVAACNKHLSVRQAILGGRISLCACIWRKSYLFAIFINQYFINYCENCKM